MRFTVFGSTGFIGRSLADALAKAGHEVLTPTRGTEASNRASLGHAIYCIGLTADFRRRPFATVHAHVSVLSAILEHTSFESLLYLSSTRVYRRSTSGHEEQALAVDPRDPSDLYNLSKLAGEALCLSCRIPEVRVARLSNVVGLDVGSGNFLSALIGDALDGHIELRTDPRSTKDYVVIDDVVAVLPEIATRGRARLYNVASGVSVSTGAIVDDLRRLTRCSVSVAANAPIVEYPPIDVSRLSIEFGLRVTKLHEALPSIVDSYRAVRSRPPPA